jgi:hypothetical protein
VNAAPASTCSVRSTRQVRVVLRDRRRSWGSGVGALRERAPTIRAVLLHAIGRAKPRPCLALLHLTRALPNMAGR